MGHNGSAMQLVTVLMLAAALSASQGNQLDYAIVVTGEELLRGAFADAHTPFIARTLLPMGLHCIGASVIDDKPADIREAVRAAAQKAPLVIVTGGLGPTVNDVTRNVLADLSGIELREHPDALAEMERRFNTPRDQLRPNLRRQVMVPVRGTYLKASVGTAVGLVFEWNGKVIVALPGPPRELQPMVRDELALYLQKRFGVRKPGASITLRFVGIGQSQIDQTMSRNVPLPPEVIVGSQFEGGRVDFTFMLPGSGPDDVARLKLLASKIREHLGEYVYSEDGSSLEAQVARAVLARGAGLNIVEIGTGGRLAASLAGLDETAKLLQAAYVAPTERAMQAILEVSRSSSEAADPLKALALAADGEWTIVAGAVTRDPAGAGSCPVLFRLGKDRWESVRVPVQGSGETAQANAVTHIWDRLRRLLAVR